MRRPVTVGLLLTYCLAVGACASAPAGSTTVLPEVARPAVIHETPAASVTIGPVERVAPSQGPRVSIRALVSIIGDSRRVRGVFRSADDAYVVVGHIDADGALRIAFPTDPEDNGFVRANESYQTNEFFAGFDSQFRFRAQTAQLWNTVASVDAYDGGSGYVFIIASWRPMRFDRFQTAGAWDSFQIANDEYLRDPRPPIYELASRLAGDNGEPYTVEFARYVTTEPLYADYTGYGYSGYGYSPYGAFVSPYDARFCSGFEPFFFTSASFATLEVRAYARLGSRLAYRGTSYYFDVALNCYRPYRAGAYWPAVVVIDAPHQIPPRRRAFDFSGHRPPPKPESLPGHVMPQPGSAPGNTEPTPPIEYRQRGAVADQPSSTGPARRQPRVARPEPATPPQTSPPAGERQPRMRVPERRSPPIQSEPMPRMPASEQPVAPTPARREEPRIEQPRIEQPRIEQPRNEPPRGKPARSEPPRVEAPRVATPRSEPPRSEPAPRREPPPEKPASSSSPPSRPPRVATPVKPPTE